MKRFRRSAQLVLLSVLMGMAAGCGDARTQSPEAAPPATEKYASLHVPATSGTIRGTVTWSGAVPVVTPFRITSNPDSPPLLKEQRQRDNPNAPVIDPSSRGVGGAVVFLRGIDPKFARPWNLPPVRVEIRERQIRIVQGPEVSRVGFVRRGDRIAMVSKEEVCHTIHAGGAAFFTLAFPDPNQPLSRRLDQTGLVELSSNAGFIWMRSHLFVSDHPYYARTDARGNFVLHEVPPGEYEVVCWMPSWTIASREHNPETGFVKHIQFSPPVETTVTARLGANASIEVNLEISAEMLLEA